MTVVLSPESQRRKWKHCQRAQTAEGPLAWPVIKDSTDITKYHKLHGKKLNFLNFLSFIKSEFCTKTRMITRRVVMSWTKEQVMLQQGSVFSAFRVCVCVCVCHINLSLSTCFCFTKIRAGNIVLHPAIAKGNRFQPLPSARPKASCPHGSLASVLPACLTPIRYQRLNVKCTASVCLASATLLYNFTPSHAKGKPSI